MARRKSRSRQVCHVVAGPNGAGKSTFALNYLPTYAGSIEYVNPDLMAQGLSPTDIRLSAIKAGKLTLVRISELIEAGVSFGFETTLAGRGHLKLLSDAKASGYKIHLYYLWMPEIAMLPVRIRHRVLDGGHDVPPDDVKRRYARSRANLMDYMALADKVYVFDATMAGPDLIWCRNGVDNVMDASRVSRLKSGGFL
ncbi:MAG: zeta toxin family protein [Kiritimatiellae bacterium]|nr:zeta toxin family protein [Kiritimatiellia bacterium]